MNRVKSAKEKQEHLDAYRASGLSVSEWCKQTGLCRTTMYRWLQAEAKTNTSAIEPSIKEEKPTVEPRNQSTKWLPITKKDEASEKECNVSSKNKLLNEEMVIEQIQVQIGNFTILAPNGFGRKAFKAICEVLLDIC